ncbi:PREDICTED: kelch repeat-containing protein At3g27220 [Tarenaya hassleriana]|uniref:kelch repeat-containing protein At3g27220 n=1 Tax=Tarenaya hassleriana TaxID=28532 RepID=UPI00053C1DD1|nr:PREDICTED: kelch repeat-containing protein At3g27220 [Tarenaya hassleriana]
MANKVDHHHHHHHVSRGLVLVLSLASLLGIGSIAGFLWSSSSSFSSSSSSSPPFSGVVSNWVLANSSKIHVTNVDSSIVQKRNKEGKGAEDGDRFLSPTFADLPAPELKWEQMPSAPVPRLDGYSVQIDNLLYVFSGYGSLDYVHSHVDVYNFTDDTWCARFNTPKEMAHSHLGIVTDGRRYVYVISGQYGPQCRGPTARSFVLDTSTRTWLEFPSLPVPRYAPATQLWRGRLHVMGGSKENRNTPATDHWSIAVEDGKAIEGSWREEIPIPRGGPHRACIVANDQLLVIGGQEGDFMAKPGSPIFKCSRRREYFYGEVYMMDDEMKWKTLPPMPKNNSHIESAWIILNNSIVIAGGTTDWHPVTKRLTMVGEIFRFRLDTLTWSVIGRLPYRVKTTMVGFWDGYLYFTSGQRDRGPDNPQPGKVIGETWRAKLKF